MSNHRIAHFSAGRVILLAITGTILIGTALLALPIARLTTIPLIDLFFTATSATCVTGLFTVPLDQFTFFGHCVILLLIQAGGLGIITLTFFLISLLFELGLAGQLMAGQLLELESRRNIKKLLIFIISTTLIIEALGALSFFMVFKNQYSMSRAIFLSVFHSISFFCNAGITLFNNSLALYAGNYSVLLTASLLMLLGGIGFLTIYEIAHLMGLINIEKRKYFSLQSKIIIYGTLITVTISSILIFLLEYNNAFAAMSTPGTLINSFFHAVSFRSAGLLAVPISSLQLATIFLIMVISFIGSAPGSTGSGIRITTLAIYLAVIKAAITSHMNVNLKGRRIAKDQINKAIAIISLAIFWIATTTFFLLITERSWEFIDVFFEAFCAFTNLGLTTGITLALTMLGKLFIMVSMIVGRIGSLTLILALKKIASRKGTEGAELVYPEERIMLS